VQRIIRQRYPVPVERRATKAIGVRHHIEPMSLAQGIENPTRFCQNFGTDAVARQQ
jgi:hypothetical protein